MAIISRFKERPKTEVAWRAMWLGLASILVFPALGIFGAVIAPLVVRSGGERAGAVSGFAVAVLALVLSVSALVTAVRAYRSGERSWVLWVGFVPATLVGVFWVLMVAGEFLFPH